MLPNSDELAKVVSSYEWTKIAVTNKQLDKEQIFGSVFKGEVPQSMVKLHFPNDFAITKDGTIYIADTDANSILRVKDHKVSIFAGTTEKGYNGDGDRLSVQFNTPALILLDKEEKHMLIADVDNFLLRDLDIETGKITTVAGIPNVGKLPENGAVGKNSALGIVLSMKYGVDDGLIYLVMRNPDMKTPNPNLYSYENGKFFIHPCKECNGFKKFMTIHDFNVTDEFTDIIEENWLHRIYKNGEVKNLQLTSGNSKGIYYDKEKGTTKLAIGNTIAWELDKDLNYKVWLQDVINITKIDFKENGYWALDSDHARLAKYTDDGKIIPEHFVGAGDNMMGTALMFAKYDEDTLLLVDNDHARIFSYKISTGAISLFAGTGQNDRFQPANDKLDAHFFHPVSIAVDKEKNVYIDEIARIIKINAKGEPSVFAGDSYPGMNENVFRTDARFSSINGLNFDNHGNLLVADTYNNRIAKIDQKGIVTTIAGTGKAGFGAMDIPATKSELNHPHAVLALPDDSLLISDSWNNRVLKLTPDGIIHPFIGKGEYKNYQGNGKFSGDGESALNALLNTPVGLVRLDDGTVLVADTFNNRIRRVKPNGIIDTIWGSDKIINDGNNLHQPFGLLVVNGDLYVGDSQHGAVWRASLDKILK